MNKFSIETLWYRYLELVKLKEHQLGSVQRSEMKKCFYGAVGQILMLLRDDLAALPEDKAVEVMSDLIEQTKQFWIVQSLPYN